MIYFVRCGEFVKIGTTVDIKLRMSALRGGCPYDMELEATLDGSHDLERRLHWENEGKRHRGEWFRLSKNEVSRIISEKLVEDVKTPPDFLSEVVRIGSVTKDGLVSATELVRAGRRWRGLQGKARFNFSAVAPARQQGRRRSLVR